MLLSDCVKCLFTQEMKGNLGWHWFFGAQMIVSDLHWRGRRLSSHLYHLISGQFCVFTPWRIGLHWRKGKLILDLSSGSLWFQLSLDSTPLFPQLFK